MEQEGIILGENQVAALEKLTDRGTEYCGDRENHEYELYLAVARKYQLQNQDVIKPNDVNKTPSASENEESCVTLQQIADSLFVR